MLITRSIKALEERGYGSFEACYLVANWGKGTNIVAHFIVGYREGRPLLSRGASASVHFNLDGELTEVSPGR